MTDTERLDWVETNAEAFRGTFGKWAVVPKGNPLKARSGVGVNLREAINDAVSGNPNRPSSALTPDIIKSVRLVFGYLEANERSHYEAHPHADHIWLDVIKARQAFESLGVVKI